MTLTPALSDPAAAVASGSLALALPVAVLAGLVSFASPCVLPLVPGYLGYVSGLSGQALTEKSRRRVVAGAVLFVLGFSLVYVVSAVFVTAAGALLVAQRDLFMRAGGVAVILMGLVFLGLGRRIGAQRELRAHWRPPAGLVGAPLLGGVFALGWVPCIGPTLGAVLIVATSTTGAGLGRGIVLVLAYCLGLGVPFVLVAVLAERVVPVQRWLSRHSRATQVFGGVLLVGIGLLLLSGLWESMIRWLQAELVTGWQVPL